MTVKENTPQTDTVPVVLDISRDYDNSIIVSL